MRKVPVLVKLYFLKKHFLSNDKKNCNTRYSYFINITKTLNLKSYRCSNTLNINGIILKLSNNTSMKEYFPDASESNFEFTDFSQDEVQKEVLH